MAHRLAPIFVALRELATASWDLLLPGSPKTGLQSKVQTPPLPNTPTPKLVANVSQKNPITNLTRNEEALLSPTEKVIAGRT